MNTKWIICPKCGEKTRVKIKETTIMKDFPLFCTWCKQETLIHVKIILSKKSKMTNDFIIRQKVA